MTSQPDLVAAVPTVESLRSGLDEADYLADAGLATALFCATRLAQPLLLEGEAGVGKTTAAESLAVLLGSPLLRLQCYEGIDAAEALYEWNYPRQLLAIRSAESAGERLAAQELFTAEFLLPRPLLRAVQHAGPLPAVLLVDEVDRADDEFEAFLFEVLAEASVTIPELGTVRASVPPVVVLTSNRTRDLSDALKRRCLYHWIDHPPVARVAEIVRRRVPASATPLAVQIATAVARLRELDLQKLPGVAEAIAWARALDLLGLPSLDQDAVQATLGTVLKYREDVEAVRGLGGGWLPVAG